MISKQIEKIWKYDLFADKLLCESWNEIFYTISDLLQKR